MLKINLLPVSARPTSLSTVEQFHRTPLLWIMLAIAVLIPLGYWTAASASQQQLNRLNGTLGVLEPRKASVDGLQQRLQQLRAEETAFRGMKQSQSGWAQRLNVLSDVTPDGVWYTELLLDHVKGLVIQGSSVGGSGPTKLVEELKGSPEFMSAVKTVQIESLKTVTVGELEIVQFTLNCSLHEAAATP